MAAAAAGARGAAVVRAKNKSKKAAAEDELRLKALQLTEAEMDAELQGWLTEHDVDQSGTLDRAEMLSLLKAIQKESIGMSMQQAVLDAAGVSADPSSWSTGHEDFVNSIFKEEARKRAAEQQQDPASSQGEVAAIAPERVRGYVLRFRSWLAKRAQIEALFAASDINRDGFLEPSELRGFLVRAAPAGYSVGDADVEYVLRKADANKDGKIQIGEVRARSASARPQHARAASRSARVRRAASAGVVSPRSRARVPPAASVGHGGCHLDGGAQE